MTFLPREIAVAVAVALTAQASFAAVLLLRPHTRAIDAAVETSRPIAIAVKSRPLLKLGSAAPVVTSKATPVAALPAAAPATRAPANAGNTTPANRPPPRRDNPVAAPAAERGAENGSAEGTEVDPLKARAADAYRAQLAGWFASRFAIRGKVPFETLRTLHASVVVSTADRRVTGFSLSAPSGESVFDEEVTAMLSRLQASGVELPAPPPAYPEMLAESVPVTFRCTVQAQCE